MHTSAPAAASALDAPHTPDNVNLRHHAGHLGHGGAQLCARGQGAQALGKLGTGAGIERHNGVARGGGHLQHFHHFINIFFACGLAVLAHRIHGCAVRAAKRSRHSALLAAEHLIGAIIEKLGKNVPAGCCFCHEQPSCYQ